MNDMILILNFSDEFSLEVARRLRAEQIYGRIISGMTTAAQIREMAPKGVILCGAAGNAPGVLDAGVLDLDAELELWFSGLGRVKLEFAANADIAAICRMIGSMVL